MNDETSLNSFDYSNFDGAKYSSLEQLDDCQVTKPSSPIRDIFNNFLRKKEEPISTTLLLDKGDADSEEESVGTIPNDIFEKSANDIRIEKEFIANPEPIVSFEYYTENSEFNGVVDKVNEAERSFDATFFDIRKKENMVATFSFDDLLYEDDADRVKVGTTFVLIVGKKRQSILNNGKIVNGGKENFCRIYLRRPRLLNPKEEVMVDEDAEHWAKLFSK